MIHGIDVSHHQNPATLPWSLIAQASKFCIVRATYGTSQDGACVEHVRRARDAGLTVGLYAFFRETDAVAEQFEAFCTVADAIDLRPGDLLPALDIERWPKVVPPSSPSDWFEVSPATSGPAEQWCELATDTFGGSIIYTSQRDWGIMGGPKWMLAYPLWCAQYPGHQTLAPATPDHGPWRIWQYNGTAPYAPGDWGVREPPAPNAIDMSWALDPLPVIAQPGQVAPGPAYEPHGPSYLTDIDWIALNSVRDQAVRST